jgi:hypothetical protein
MHVTSAHYDRRHSTGCERFTSAERQFGYRRQRKYERNIQRRHYTFSAQVPAILYVAARPVVDVTHIDCLGPRQRASQGKPSAVRHSYLDWSPLSVRRLWLSIGGMALAGHESRVPIITHVRLLMREELE